MAKKQWKSSDVDYLKRYGVTKTPEELAQRFDVDIDTVRTKLRELGIEQKTRLVSAIRLDPALEGYEKAVETVHKGKWKEAAKLFEKVLEETDQPELAERARQYLALCHNRTDETPDDAADDPYLRAVFLKNRGQLDEALKLATTGGRNDSDERFAYLAASIHALQEDDEKARKALEKAIELDPAHRVHAYHDPDFAQIRQDEQLADLFEIS